MCGFKNIHTLCRNHFIVWSRRKMHEISSVDEESTRLLSLGVWMPTTSITQFPIEFINFMFQKLFQNIPGTFVALVSDYHCSFSIGTLSNPVVTDFCRWNVKSELTIPYDRRLVPRLQYVIPYVDTKTKSIKFSFNFQSQNSFNKF